ncbi:MAG TPA: AMP-binding protein [Pseudonocardia sp.]|nr:AMP-binding protein [Pseudonocardia sp.]
MSEHPHARPGWGDAARLTIPAGLSRSAEASPDKLAVRFPQEDVTYQQMWRRSTALANGLAELGVGRDDSVAVLMRNSADQLFTWFATAMLGAVYVPINTAYRGTYLRHPLEVASVRVLVVDEHLSEPALAVASQLDSLRHLVVRGGDITGLDAGRVAVHPLESLTSAESGRLLVPVSPAWNDPNAVLFTAGTTGPSKGGSMTQNYLVRAAQQILHARGGRPEDVYYNPLPLFHGNAMLLGALGPLLSGATAAFEENFSVSRFWDRVRHFGATQLSILGPLMLMLWKQDPRPDDADNPARVMMAVPIPAELHRPIEERFGLRIVTAYGLSECVPVTLSSLADPAPPGSSGKPNPMFDVRLFDDDDQEVPAGEVGEIVCRPLEPHVMFEGYLNNPEATARMWRNLWFHTGDLGRFDEHRNLSFVDRKKDYLRRRGENISSFEVERGLLEHPDVLEAAVLGVPSDLSEEEVMAFLVRRPGSDLDHQGLLDHCVAHLPYFAVPRYLEFVDELPKNPVGRVQKFTLRERGVGAATFDREAAGYVIERTDRRPQPA